PLPRQVRWSLFARLSPSPAAFPVLKPGRLLQLFFRGLLSVYSRYGRHARGVAMRPFPSKSSDSFVASAAASIATEWSEPVPGRELHPLKSKRLSRRTLSPMDPNPVITTVASTDYCSLEYSAFACFRMGMSGSASFQRSRKSLYSARART